MTNDEKEKFRLESQRDLYKEALANYRTYFLAYFAALVGCGSACFLEGMRPIEKGTPLFDNIVFIVELVSSMILVLICIFLFAKISSYTDNINMKD